MKTRLVVLVVTAVIFISFAISTFSSIVSLSALVEQSSTKEAEMFLTMVEKDIVDSFSDSVSISKTINNSYVKDFIVNRSDFSESEASEYIGNYLNDLKHQFGYDTAFLTIDVTKEYFTEYGRTKVLDIDGDDDRWYREFKSSGKELELNVDNDQANDNRITVYNNIRMLDNEGNFIGICGVGHTLENLNNAIDSLEQKYKLSVMLIDENCMIQVAGDDSLPGTKAESYISDYIINYDKNIEYEYDAIGKGGYVIIKYVPEYDWYLFISSPEKTDGMTRIIIYNLLAAFAALIIMVKIVSVAIKYQEDETLLFKADSESDMMTGIYNRRAFDNMMDSIRESKSVRDISVIVIDINGLKQANDEKGHLAGDELIVNTAECIKELYENHGRCFRIGGDEFVIFILEPLDDVENIIKEIKSRVALCELKYSESLSVSVGVVRGEDYQDLSIDQLIEKADKLMYLDKEEFYKDKKHERRTR